MIKQTIESELKKAMLSADKDVVSVLRTLKGAILDIEIQKNARESGLPEEEMISILQKEVKKRLDSAQIYEGAGDLERAQKEFKEVEIIRNYLPEPMSQEDLAAIVKDVAKDLGEISAKDMGKLIGLVKSKVGGQADGSQIAQAVKEYIG